MHKAEIAQIAQRRAERERRACFIAVHNRSEGIPISVCRKQMMTIIQQSNVCAGKLNCYISIAYWIYRRKYLARVKIPDKSNCFLEFFRKIFLPVHRSSHKVLGEEESTPGVVMGLPPSLERSVSREWPWPG
ncbi:hypothetical protein KTQ42_04720|uniref:hypothetical protein n=1 Tax=Noviherbaspirillum sp. L7-7A TaxID=2850560 RepID=UPI001C2B8F16|nr:hypothetical protein [Noviherbaspirillum sp. L7-7A]MBV0878603.1 hypothetical protein [Noviherbaspirillum sp. L7-7A]